ncbi:MAG: hydantoinase/oxoprolinase family protein [Alphaproteobacteria bacterium]|nr:hydantoinase/oxoprolinase family protein [Alphaproteobacteria bacterium]
MTGLRIGVDIGGTFTDLVAIAADGTITTVKTESTPHDYSIGIAHGLERLLGSEGIAEVLHATTVGSNTILEGKGAKTGLITSAGFRDVLEIRDLRMPRLYDMHWTKPPALVERRLRLEVREKVQFDGRITTKLDRASLDFCIARLRQERVASVAVCLLHSYANPAHEQEVAAALRAALPDVAVSVSHEILPEIKEYPRTSTTVVNAYVQPVVRAYITSLVARLQALGITAPLHLMQSNGGLASATTAADFPVRIIESGPAAGVVGAGAMAKALGEAQLVTFDMGGTTAKAGLVENGEVLRSEAMEVGGGVLAGARLLVGAGYMLKLPAIDLAEVGAGGGSICHLDAAGAPKVGPRSAGADPGPVCYGRGGSDPTITDCNLVLGYLDPAGLAGGSLPLDRAAAEAAIRDRLAVPLGITVEAAAHGMLRLAASTMMRAIRAVSVERGRDVRRATLFAFGGNGPLFAAGIAAELGMARVLIPPMPGLFSAFGLLVADTEHHLSRSIRAFGADATALQSVIDGLRHEGLALLRRDGFDAEAVHLSLGAKARYAGQSSEIAVPLATSEAKVILADLPEAFARAHEATYGFRAPPGEVVELIDLTLIARGIPGQPRMPARIPAATNAVPGARDAWFAGAGWVATRVVDRAGIGSQPIAGPLIIQEYDATCLVPPGATAFVDDFGNIEIRL